MDRPIRSPHQSLSNVDDVDKNNDPQDYNYKKYYIAQINILDISDNTIIIQNAALLSIQINYVQNSDTTPNTTAFNHTNKITRTGQERSYWGRGCPLHQKSGGRN
jgi:hypothetical protein